MTPLRTLIAETARLEGESDDALNQRVADAYPAFARTPRADFVTYTSLGSVWGVARAAAVKATLKAIIAAPETDPTTRAVVDYVHGLLAGPGFDPHHAEAPAYLAIFVGDGVITPAEADRVRYVYPEAPGKEQVAAERQDMEFVAWAAGLDQYRKLGPLPASALANQTLTAEQMAQVAEAMMETINQWRGKTDLTGRPEALAAFVAAVDKVTGGEGA
jgi:hypothetical protein